MFVPAESVAPICEIKASIYIDAEETKQDKGKGEGNYTGSEWHVPLLNG
jgi:hypothetical protein